MYKLYDYSVIKDNQLAADIIGTYFVSQIKVGDVHPISEANHFCSYRLRAGGLYEGDVKHAEPQGKHLTVVSVEYRPNLSGISLTELGKQELSIYNDNVGLLFLPRSNSCKPLGFVVVEYETNVLEILPIHERTPRSPWGSSTLFHTLPLAFRTQDYGERLVSVTKNTVQGNGIMVRNKDGDIAIYNTTTDSYGKRKTRSMPLTLDQVDDFRNALDRLQFLEAVSDKPTNPKPDTA